MVERYHPGTYHERSNLLIRMIERRRTSWIVRLLEVGGDESVIEVGVGAGNVLERVPAARRFGLDLSMRLLGDARRRLGRRAGFIQGDAAALPIASRSIDRVICSEVLEHLPDPSAAVAEIARVVRQHGIVVLSVPNEPLIDRIKMVLRWARVLPLFSSKGYGVPADMKDEWHLHEFDRTRLTEIVEPNLTIERIVGVPSDFFPVRWVARCRPAAAH